jgi:hypothetical protein
VCCEPILLTLLFLTPRQHICMYLVTDIFIHTFRIIQVNGVVIFCIIFNAVVCFVLKANHIRDSAKESTQHADVLMST